MFSANPQFDPAKQRFQWDYLDLRPQLNGSVDSLHLSILHEENEDLEEIKDQLPDTLLFLLLA